jgi:hypothetical protein
LIGKKLSGRARAEETNLPEKLWQHLTPGDIINSIESLEEAQNTLHQLVLEIVLREKNIEVLNRTVEHLHSKG